jgi:hypothetical protein
MANGKWFAFKAIKGYVEELGVVLGDLKNPDASVLSVLNRLVNNKELEQTMTKKQGTNEEIRVWRKVVNRLPVESKPVSDDEVPF